jgi:hypothetical protein
MFFIRFQAPPSPSQDEHLPSDDSLGISPFPFPVPHCCPEYLGYLPVQQLASHLWQDHPTLSSPSSPQSLPPPLNPSLSPFSIPSSSSTRTPPPATLSLHPPAPAPGVVVVASPPLQQLLLALPTPIDSANGGQRPRRKLRRRWLTDTRRDPMVITKRLVGSYRETATT